MVDPSVTVVLVGWDPVETRRSRELLTQWAHSTGVQIDRVMLVWNNAGLTAPNLSDCTSISGSNDELDIGGYAEGLRAVVELDGEKPDRVWLFCNDRIAHYEPETPVLGFLGPISIGLARTGCMIGWVHSGGPPVYAHGITGEAWVQTHCLLVGGSPKQLALFEESLSVLPAKSIRLEGSRFVADPDIEVDFLDLLSDGLIRQQIGDPVWIWPGATDLQHTIVPFIEKKARSVAVEHIMTIGFCSHGSVVGVGALPDVLAGYQSILPPMGPVLSGRIWERLWWRIRPRRDAIL